MKEARYERVPTIRLHIYEILEQAKPTYSEKYQNKGWLCERGEKGKLGREMGLCKLIVMFRVIIGVTQV